MAVARFVLRFARASSVRAVTVGLPTAVCSPGPDLDAKAKKPFDALRKTVRKETSNPARADSMLARIDSLQQRSLELIRSSRAENDTLIRIYADRSVEDAALVIRFREGEQHRAELRRSLLEVRAKLKPMASPAEWATLSKAETKAISQVAGQTRGK